MLDVVIFPVENKEQQAAWVGNVETQQLYQLWRLVM